MASGKRKIMFQNTEYVYAGETNMWGDACGEGTLTPASESKYNPAPVGFTNVVRIRQTLKSASQP